MPSPQARYFILTIPVSALPIIPQPRDELVYLKGQKEIGAGGYEHWQLVCSFNKKVTIIKCKSYFCREAHVELSRSAAAEQYVWKEDTRVAGSQFEYGAPPFNPSRKIDWEKQRDLAKANRLEEIDAGVYVRSYSSLKRIAADNMVCPSRPNVRVKCFWGGTGLGKSRRAWFEAGENAYTKDPNTKWWDGYRGQKRVIIDEFTGLISINHVLRWLDRYPVQVEQKGGACPLIADEFWITSNVDPRLWYQDINEEQKRALLRRMEVVQFVFEWRPPSLLDEVLELF